MMYETIFIFSSHIAHCMHIHHMSCCFPVIFHIGTGFISGHFVVAKRFASNWVLFNDSSVKSYQFCELENYRRIKSMEDATPYLLAFSWAPLGGSPRPGNSAQFSLTFLLMTFPLMTFPLMTSVFQPSTERPLAPMRKLLTQQEQKIFVGCSGNHTVCSWGLGRGGRGVGDHPWELTFGCSTALLQSQRKYTKLRTWTIMGFHGHQGVLVKSCISS